MSFRQVGVIALPEVTEYVLKPEDEFLVLASDGVWEFIDNQEVSGTVAHSCWLSMVVGDIPSVPSTIFAYSESSAGISKHVADRSFGRLLRMSPIEADHPLALCFDCCTCRSGVSCCHPENGVEPQARLYQPLFRAPPHPKPA